MLKFNDVYAGTVCLAAWFYDKLALAKYFVLVSACLVCFIFFVSALLSDELPPQLREQFTAWDRRKEFSSIRHLLLWFCAGVILLTSKHVVPGLTICVSIIGFYVLYLAYHKSCKGRKRG